MTPTNQDVTARAEILPDRRVFPEGLALARPRVAEPQQVARDVTKILESGVLTNGPYVRRLEEQVEDYVGVKHCIAVASCTAGLMLVLRAKQLTGDVILPSFTFAATAHAVAWNGLRPVFVDIDPVSLTLSPDSVRAALGMRTAAILGTHTFGTPCDIRSLSDLALRHGVSLLFDAAHAFGSRYRDRQVGRFGHAEVFSMSATKLLIAGEGGLITTNDDILAQRCRIGRDYGNPGDYDCRFVGLNARLSEVHAATALASFVDIEERIAARNAIADAYKAALRDLPGITFPEVKKEDRSTYKDFTILVEPEDFGLDAAAIGASLGAAGIETRRYYAPPVHAQSAYAGVTPVGASLEVTNRMAARVLTLPLWVGMTEDHVAGVFEALVRIRRAAARKN